MSDPAVTADEIFVPADAFDVIDVSSGEAPDLTRSSGQRFTTGLQHRFSGHKIMGSDGLSEIVTMQLTRMQANALEEVVAARVAELRRAHSLAAGAS